MAEPYFRDIERIGYEGPDSGNPLAFRWYDADRKVAGRRMQDHLRFAVCYWHSFGWNGSDVFGEGSFARPWLGAGDALALARRRTEVAFEFFAKLGAPFFTFHDRDLAPEGRSLAESEANLDRMLEVIAAEMQRTGVELLWGTANLFGHPRYAAGAATNPDPEVFACAAAQVRKALEATHQLGGANYVSGAGAKATTRSSTPICDESRSSSDASSAWWSNTSTSSAFAARCWSSPSRWSRRNTNTISTSLPCTRSCCASASSARSASTSRSITPRSRATASSTRSLTPSPTIYSAAST
jgi:hypothetical protein